MAKKAINENKDTKPKKTAIPKKTTGTRAKSCKKVDESSNTDNRAVLVVSNNKRRSKEEIAAEKAAKAQRKLEREQKKVALAAKRLAREQKKAEREAKIKAKEEAAAAKEKQNAENAKIQKIIDSLKVSKDYVQPKPMTIKEKDLCKKILENPNTSMSICSQTCGQHAFNILSHRTNEFLISIDSTYYFYNKEKNTGINFGIVYSTWCNTCKRIPWTDPDLTTVNIDNEEKKNASNSTQGKQLKRTKKSTK